MPRKTNIRIDLKKMKMKISKSLFFSLMSLKIEHKKKVKQILAVLHANFQRHFSTFGLCRARSE